MYKKKRECVRERECVCKRKRDSECDRDIVCKRKIEREKSNRVENRIR